jgi:hypothetical protein
MYSIDKENSGNLELQVETATLDKQTGILHASIIPPDIKTMFLLRPDQYFS